MGGPNPEPQRGRQNWERLHTKRYTLLTTFSIREESLMRGPRCDLQWAQKVGAYRPQNENFYTCPNHWYKFISHANNTQEKSRSPRVKSQGKRPSIAQQAKRRVFRFCCKVKHISNGINEQLKYPVTFQTCVFAMKSTCWLKISRLNNTENDF